MKLEQTWPPDSLESVADCPGCGSDHRQMLYDGLTDGTYGVAPGKWTMWRCDECATAYLDPRPNMASIGAAYGSYYTHKADPSDQRDRASLKDRLRLATMRDYLNKTYGYQLHPSLPLAKLWLALKPESKAAWDEGVRHLPQGEEGSRLLDIGCGNGDFLMLAEQLGYSAKGLDPDDKAAALCRERGFDVDVGGLPDTGQAEDSFDHVTLSHVLEHLHDPSAALNEIYRILRPGGRIWITQPNISSIGHKVFGEAWRGLEVPRHLVLLTITALEQMLARIGYSNVQLHQPANHAISYFQRSVSIMKHVGQDDRSGWDEKWAGRATDADSRAKSDSALAESLIVSAFKPLK